jgi:predicted nucleotidyltransferase
MPRFDFDALVLAPRHRELLGALLQRHIPTAEVWAYGSRVNGDCHEASDLDLVARNPASPEDELPDLVDLKEALVESNLPIRVDVVDWARIPASFRREIERAYVVVQEGRG